MFMPLDSTMFLLVPVIILAFYAQSKVSSNFNKFSKLRNTANLSGSEVAEEILRRNGITNVQVRPVTGHLTDNYNPMTKIVNLSEEVYHGRSVAAISIAAHEVGHSLQHAKGYVPVVLRGSIVPIANISSTLAFPLFFIGLFFSSFSFLMDIGIILFLGVLAFHLVTLPVEFDASSRALRQLSNGIVRDEEELGYCRKMLNSAALTYVAATLMALMNLIRMLILRGERD